MSQNNKNDEEEKEIIQPNIRSRPHFMMGEGKSKLEHPRRVLWQWLFSYIKPFRMKFFLFLILLIIGSLISSITPLISASIIDNGIIASDSEYIIYMSTFYFALLFIMAVITYYSQYGMGKVSQSITFEVRNDLFFKLQDMSLTYFDRRSSGDIISITTNDVTLLNQLVGGQFIQIISSIVSLSLTIVIMYFLNVFLALISMVVFPLFFFITYLFRKVAVRLFKESRKTIGNVTSSIQENVAGAKVVQAYGQEKRASIEFDRANLANYNAMVKIRKFMATVFPLITFVSTILTALVLLAGGFTVLEGIPLFGQVVTLGVLSAYITILGQFFRPFMTLIQIQEVMASALASSDRIFTLLEEKVEIPDVENPIELISVAGDIKFESVSFGYKFEEEKAYKVNEKSNPKQSQPISKVESNNPMMQKILKYLHSLPEPYSSFMLENAMKMPQNIRQKLFMALMGINPSEAPQTIDAILLEFGYAVPGSQNSKENSQLKTSFSQEKESTLNSEMPQLSSQMIVQMAKVLERNLKSQATVQSSSSSGFQSQEGGMMSSSMKIQTPETILKFLARIEIPNSIKFQIPKIVRDAIEEQRKIFEHERSTGYVLKNVDLEIPAGKTVAIVGETGAGKTTIVKLISRFYDINNGKINLDGFDIRKISKKALRDLIGLVPQDAFLFTGTIKENLLYAFENPKKEIEDKMISVSKFLGLHNFIEALHKKYDTKLKENASNISIGQRQLIAFARALITDPKILILDEATSSVDPYTETLIQDALDKAREGRTTIIIAHRLSTIKNADHIIVISADKKGIIEEGNHEELMNLDGKYKRLLEMQHREIEVDE
ncbi:MAG: ATP-binding cassette domain-containing protein [Promethearchaeota archaeon]|nr:MAG: ATP-binding cassette domain-containing protein [Candidatus Lokiarchaeota archaeon]